MIHIFIKGVILGFVVAAPVGPVGVICFRRTLTKGRLNGIFSGMGAAVADVFFGAIAAFSLTHISNFLIKMQWWLRLFGGLFLIYLGITNFFKKFETSVHFHGASLLNAFTSTFFITISNPVTIFAFATIFTFLGLLKDPTVYEAISLIAGIFIGSMTWWIIVSEIAHIFKKRISLRTLELLNKIISLAIAGFGVIIIVTLII